MLFSPDLSYLVVDVVNCLVGRGDKNINRVGDSVCFKGLVLILTGVPVRLLERIRIGDSVVCPGDLRRSSASTLRLRSCNGGGGHFRFEAGFMFMAFKGHVNENRL